MVAYGVSFVSFCPSLPPPLHSARFLCVHYSSCSPSFYWPVAAYLTFWRSPFFKICFLGFIFLFGVCLCLSCVYQVNMCPLVSSIANKELQFSVSP